MDIFKNLVPFVAFFAPTGKERFVGSGEIVTTQYGFSAKFDDTKPYYIPVGKGLVTNVGETFKSAKIAELIRSGYDRNSKGELIIRPLPDARKIWRVVELYK
jgi:hypothetical protein